MGFVIAVGGKPNIYIHDADLTDNGRVSNPSLTAQTKEATTFADSGVKRKVGLKEISYRFEGLFDSAAQKAHAALNDLRTNQRIISIYAEGDALAKEGVALPSAHAEQYESAPSVGELVPLSASIVSDAEDLVLVSLGAKPAAAITVTTALPGLDNGAGSSAGGVFIVHAFTFSATGGNAQWVAHLEDSDNDGGGDPYADVTTLTFTAVGAQRATFTGAVKRWLRVRWVRDATSGSLLAQAGAVRG